VVLVSSKGVPLGVQIAAASVAETALAEPTLKELNDLAVDDGFRVPPIVIADKGYDSDSLRDTFACYGIKLLAPHRSNRKRPSRNDGRTMRRYRRRWIVERSFGWFHNFRRLVTRYDRTLRAFRAFVHVACVVIALRHL
jgi:transposase